MKYITPVYDRTAADVASKTAKGYFNLADWLRVYRNSRVMHNLVKFLIPATPAFSEVAEPVLCQIPTATLLNSVLANIENARVASGMTGGGLVAIKTNWAGGINESAPKYTHANDWERVIDILYNGIGDFTGYTGWIPDSATPVRRARTNVAAAGSGLTRNNYFRRYA